MQEISKVVRNKERKDFRELKNLGMCNYKDYPCKNEALLKEVYVLFFKQ